MIADADGGFCSDYEHYLTYGRANAPWGLQGVVSVDGLAVLLFSRATGLMLSGLSIPAIQQLIGTFEIDRTEVWLYLEGPQLNGVIKIEGTISQITIAQ